MEKKIAVQMTKEALYDFLLYHTYSKFSGFLTNILGMAVGIMGAILLVVGKIGIVHFVIYLAAAAAFIGYTPLQLRQRAKKQMQVNKDYQQIWEYTFSEEGILAVHGEKSQQYPWEKIQKVVTAPKTIGIYYGKDLAFIIPKEAFGQEFVAIMQMFVAHLGAQNVRLR